MSSFPLLKQRERLQEDTALSFCTVTENEASLPLSASLASR